MSSGDLIWKNSAWVTLVVRDPDWGYAFWRVTAAGIQRARSLLGRDGLGAPLILRLYTMRGKHRTTRPRFTDYTLERWIDEQPVALEPGMNHQVAIGVRSKANAFSPLCRSPMVAALLGRQEEPDCARFAQIRCESDRLLVEEAVPPAVTTPAGPEEWQPPSLFGAPEEGL